MAWVGLQEWMDEKVDKKGALKNNKKLWLQWGVEKRKQCLGCDSKHGWSTLTMFQGGSSGAVKDWLRWGLWRSTITAGDHHICNFTSLIIVLLNAFFEYSQYLPPDSLSWRTSLRASLTMAMTTWKRWLSFQSPSGHNITYVVIT